MAGVLPMILLGCGCGGSPLSPTPLSARRCNARCAKAFDTVFLSSSKFIGLEMKSKAPSWIASTAVSIEPNAVMTMIGRDGYFSCTMRVTSKPERPGMRTSVINRSKSSSPKLTSAWSPEKTFFTRQPSSSRVSANSWQLTSSSSAISIYAFISVPDCKVGSSNRIDW